MDKDSLILGIDGGGSKTAVRIAQIDSKGAIITIGEGYSGPSNVRAVGQLNAELNLNTAVKEAQLAAGLVDQSIDYAILALAGSSLPDVQSIIMDWVTKISLATHADIINDAAPVLAAGIKDGIGVAMIIGTGSIAVAADETGKQSVVGGWGHRFGDAGSGYDLGRRALAAMANAVDGIEVDTSLVERILDYLEINDPREVSCQLGLSKDIHRKIASIARILLAAAEEEQDAVAIEIVQKSAMASARLADAAMVKLTMEKTAPLALAGGVIVNNKMYRELILNYLSDLGTHPQTVAVVDEPVEGSLIIAKNRLLKLRKQ